MTKRWIGVLAACVLLGGLAGCAARQTVVLVPDAAGRVGKVEVATAGGKQLLTKASDMTRVGGPSSAPSAVETADPEYIATTFHDALGVEPAPPDRFVLYFETGTTILTADSQAAIPSIVAAVKRRTAISIAVSGHTDTVGSDDFNDHLAFARAQKVRDLLRQQGIPSDSILLSSHGKGNPAVPTPDGVAEPRNRRVEVVVQ